MKELRYDIQGLRAVAVLGVILFHFNKAWLPGGFVGVDIFFVISGFLISSIILRAKENGQFSFRQFYLSRIRRIVPAYVVMLIVVTVGVIVLFDQFDAKFFKRSLVSALYFNSAHYFGNFGGYFSPSAYELPLQHTWTLAVEMQFYLLLPVLLYFLPLRWSKLAVPLLAVALLGWSEYAIRVLGDVQGTYFSLPARIPEFLVGTIIALLALGRTWSNPTSVAVGVTGALLLVLSFIIIDEKTAFPGLWAFLPCAGAACLIMSRVGPISSFLNLRGMVWIGGLSYSLYLWHWPVLAFTRYYLGTYEIPLGWYPVLLTLIFLLSWASYRFVETPFRSGSNLRLAYGLIPAFCILLAIAIPMRSANLLFAGASSVQDLAPPQRCNNQILDNCIRGSNDASIKPFLVFGDSVGDDYATFFDEVGRRENLSFNVLTTNNCWPYLALVDLEAEQKWFGSEESFCTRLIAVTPQYIDQADVIILRNAWSKRLKSDEVIQRFDKFLDKMEDQDKTVVMLSDHPYFVRSPVRDARFKRLGLPMHREFELDGQQREINKTLKNLAERHRNAYFIDLTDSPVFANPPFYNDMIVYKDTHHLSSFAMREEGRWAASRVGAYLRSLPNVQSTDQTPRIIE